MPSHTETLLEVRDLAIKFRSELGAITIVERLNFSVRAGEILTLVGESGSGKTMTALAIMGLIENPNAIITGSVKFNGIELLGRPRSFLQKIRGSSIAMIFQDALSAMTPVHTIGWQISEQILRHNRVGGRRARLRAIELLDQMGMPEPELQYNRFPHQLSGGMRQRAMIAMALSCNPPLLIADEPTTALDVTIQAQILNLIRDLRSAFGSSIIFVTHDMGVVSELADSVMVLYAGKIVEYGPRDTVLKSPIHPYTIGLLNSIPPLTGDKPDRLTAIPGQPPSVYARPRGCPFAPRCLQRHSACETDPPLQKQSGRLVSCQLIMEGAIL